MHTEPRSTEPHGAFCTNGNGDELTFACALCDAVIREPAVLRLVFSARIDDHYATTHGMEEWSIRNLDGDATEALSCIFDGQDFWLADFDHDERNNH
jgi:hypothetical protein